MKPRPFDPSILQQIRSRFHYPDPDPRSGPRVYLDAAAGSLRLRQAVSTLETLSRWPAAIGRPSPGSRQAGDSIARGIASVREFLGAGDRVVMPAMSAVHAIFRAVGAAAGEQETTSSPATSIIRPPSMRPGSSAPGSERRSASPG